MATRHFSYYVNLSTLAGVIGSVYLGARALRLEEQKAGIENKPIVEVLKEDAVRIKDWVDRKVNTPKMYRHF